jgi:acyl carrier protein
MKQQILDRLNEIIAEEKGVRVTMDSKWIDAELDSLGSVMTVVMLEDSYPDMFKDMPTDADALSLLDFEHLTIRELINRCRLSTIDTSKQPNDSQA